MEEGSEAVGSHCDPEVFNSYRNSYGREYNVLQNQSVVAQIITAWDLMMAIVTDEVANFRQFLPRIDLTTWSKFVICKVKKFDYQNAVRRILHYVPRPVVEPLHYYPATTDDFKFTGYTLLDVKRMIQSNSQPYEVYLRPITFSDVQVTDFIEKDEYFSETTQLDTASTLGPGSDATPQMNRVAALELELELMKKQLAMVMAAVAANPPPGLSIPVVSENPIQKSVNPAPVAVNPPPPPPPPPLPLLSNPKPIAINSKPSTSLESSILKETDRVKSTQDSKESVPSMSDVLKELNTIKLRSVPRSPGGTPCRLGSKSDSGNFLEEALIQKFRNANLHDSSTDSICMWEDEQDEN